MTWFRSDDDLPEHVKADALESAAGDPATLAAAWMTWLHMGCDCAKRRTDGGFNQARAHRAVRLPPAMVDAALAALVRAGLLDLEGDGYRFHDWCDYQPTKEELDADRKANADRQKAWRVRQREAREAKARNAVTNAVTDSVTNAVRNERLSRETTPAPVTGDTSAPVTAPRPVPSRPVPKEEKNPERAGDAVPARQPALKIEPSRASEEAPPVDPKARAVFEVIMADPLLRPPCTRRVADLALRLTAPDAFPGVNVLAQVLRAATWNAGQRKPKRDGRAFLLGWLGRSDPEAPQPLAPAALLSPRRRPVEEPGEDWVDRAAAEYRLKNPLPVTPSPGAP